MVKVAENRADVICRVRGTAEAGPQEGWWSVPVLVEKAADFEGYPNLLGADLPREMIALVPAKLFDEGLSELETWWLEAEMVGPRRLLVRALASPPPGRPGTPAS